MEYCPDCGCEARNSQLAIKWNAADVAWISRNWHPVVEECTVIAWDHDGEIFRTTDEY